MRRWICLALALVCALGIGYADWLLSNLAGQAQFRLPLKIGEGSARSIGSIAEGMEAEWAAFALREGNIGEAGDGLIYDCLFYDSRALGILLIAGSPLTPSHIAGGEPVALLNERAAMRISPSLDCIGDRVKIDGQDHRIVGIYREYEPLLLLTRTALLGAIIPARPSDAARRVFVWTRTESASPFAFGQARSGLRTLVEDGEAGAFQALDLDGVSRMNRQAIRLLVLAALAILCGYGLRALRESRRRFRTRARAAFARDYGFRACVHTTWPFLRGMLPSLLLTGGWLGYLALFANRLIIDADRVPTQLLDPEAWLTKLESATMAGNMAEQMPVFSCLLSAQVQWMLPVLGILGIGLLLVALCPNSKKDGV